MVAVGPVEQAEELAPPGPTSAALIAASVPEAMQPSAAAGTGAAPR